MLGHDVPGSVEIGDRAGELDDSVACTGRESHCVYYALKQFLAVSVERAELLCLPVVHCGITEYPFSLETFALYLPRLEYSGGNGCAGLRRLPVHKPSCLDPGNDKLEVDPVHDGT